jgi:hypothetical protein
VVLLQLFRGRKWDFFGWSKVLSSLDLVLPSAKALQEWMTEITQPCIHMCNGLLICQLYSLPDLLQEMDCKEDTLPFASFISLSQLIIVIWIKTSVGITTVFHTGISRAVAAA